MERHNLLLSATCGLLGVATGISLFLLLVSDAQFGWRRLVVALVLTALVSVFFEYLRSEIDGQAEKQSPSRVAFSILMLLFFELLMTAMHDAVANDEGRTLMRIAGSVVRGRTIPEHSRIELNLLAMVGVWVAIGTAIAFVLAIRSAELEIPGVYRGLFASIFVAPACSLIYVTSARFLLEIEWILRYPAAWTAYLKDHYSYIPWGWTIGGVIKVLFWCAIAMNHQFHGYSPIVMLVAMAVLGFLFRRYGVPLRYLFYGFFLVTGLELPILLGFIEDYRLFFKLVALVILVWTVPAILLGVFCKYLRRQAGDAKVWTVITCLAAVVVTIRGFQSADRWYLAGACALLFSSLLTRRSEPIRIQQWPVIAFSIAITVAGITSFTMKGGFFEVNDLSWIVINDPESLRISTETEERPLEDIVSYRSRFARRVARRELLDVSVQGFQEGTAQMVSLLDADRAALALAFTSTSEHLAMRELEQALNEEAEIEHDLYEANVGLLQPISMLDVVRQRNPLEFVLSQSNVDERGMVTVEEAGLRPEFQASVRELVRSRNALFAASSPLRNTLDNEKVRLAKLSQVCITGALAFWISLSAFTTWAIREKRRRTNGDIRTFERCA